METIKKVVVLNKEIDNEKFYKCSTLLLNAKKEVVIVGDKLYDEIMRMLEEIHDYRGGYDFIETSDCYISKSQLNHPNVYTSLKKFLTDFPEILNRYSSWLNTELSRSCE